MGRTICGAQSEGMLAAQAEATATVPTSRAVTVASVWCQWHLKLGNKKYLVNTKGVRTRKTRLPMRQLAGVGETPVCDLEKKWGGG